MLNLGKPARLGSVVVPGMPYFAAQFVPAWSLTSLLVVRVRPIRNSLIKIGVKTRVSETPYSAWPLSVLAPKVPKGLPEKGLLDVSQRSRARTDRLSFAPSLWSTLKTKLSQLSGALAFDK